jgi:hypothetical protein
VEPKFHQVAMYCGSVAGIERSVKMFKDMGFVNWTFDTALLDGVIDGLPAQATGYMAFNYDILPGIEYELLAYDGQTRWDLAPIYHGERFISHISYHVENLEAEMADLAVLYGPPIQVFETHQHTNEVIKGVKRFKEAIFNTREHYGHDIKLIERIPWGDG